MKKNLYTKMLNSAVHMFTMMFLLFWCGNANAAVQGTGTIEDPYVLAVGETYQVTAFKELYCTFTATENGTLEVPYNSPQLVVYTDATYQTQAETQPAAETGNYTYCTLNCVAGTTYYLGAISPVPMDNGSFTIDFYTDGKPISLVNINPVEGSVITASTDVIDMKFNQNITMDQTCTMTSGDNSETLSTQVLGTFANTSFKNKLAQWYIDGKVAKGDEIKFKFTGIKANNEYANLYNETGELELTYVLGAKPMMLVSTTNTPNGDPSMSTFLSYYAYGAEAGVVTLTFDGEVNTESVPTAELGYGNRQGEDEYYLETFSTTVEGNTVIVDLRGKLRDKEVIGYIDGINTIMLTVKGVKDVDGNNTYTDLSGSTGKYSFIYDYENIEYSVDTDATLDNGSTINNDTKSIELWFNETGGTATYTGVELKYISGGEEKYTYFSLDDLTIAKSGTETTITIPMPAINIDENSTVTVSLTDVVRPDGKTTVEDFTATFTCDGRTAPVLVVTPAPESSVTALDKVVFGCTEGIKINANATEPIVIYKNRNTVVATIALADLVADDDFTFSYTLAEPVTEETTYRISIPEGTFLLGAKENANEATYVTFSVSTPTVLNVIPANESTIESLSQITFNCEKGIGIDWNITEPIVIYKGRTEVARITGEDLTQPEDWDDIYNLFYTFPEPITEEGAYRVVIPQGLFLLGTWGETSSEATTISYTISTPTVLNVIPANESTIESLSQITFNCEKGIGIDWNITEPIVIYKDRTEVARITGEDLTQPEDWDDIYNLFYTFPEPITEEGVYRVVIPQGLFLLGTWGETSSEATTITYTISKPTVLNVIPANESTVESLSQITFNCEQGIGIDWNITEPIVIYKDRTEVARITGEDLTQPEDWDDIYNLFYTFPEPITEAGVYRVVIPQGLFLLGTWGETSSEATTITYTISKPTVLNVIPASESTVESLSQITFNCEQGIGIDWNCTTPITISKRDMGNVVEVAQITGEDLTWPDDWDDIYNLFYNLAEPITEAGTYIVNIPAGFFIFGEYGDAANEATIVYYTVQPPVEILISPEPGTVAEIPTTLTLTLPANGGFRDGTAPILTDADGNSYNAVFELHPTDWNKVNIILDAPITTDGTYTLTIPAGSLEWEPEYVAYDKELTFVFVVSAATGIDEFVKAEGGKVDVYAVNGTIIMHNADAAKIKTLKKGLYVINGKKIIIK